MRLRKKSWSGQVFELHKDVCIPDYETLKGTWKTHLDTQTIRLEIGSGKGDYWHGLGELYPDDGIIAMERDFTASSIALRKLETYGYGKKRFIYGDAMHLDKIFEAEEVSIIHLNFSDPWPKTRHEKRRLTHKDKLAEYHRILEPNGSIWMKTDNRQLFEYSLVHVSMNGFVLESVSLDFRNKDSEDDDPYTEYERKFTDRGCPIYRAIWRKVNVK